jgi:hypothetical protein
VRAAANSYWVRIDGKVKRFVIDGIPIPAIMTAYNNYLYGEVTEDI